MTAIVTHFGSLCCACHRRGTSRNASKLPRRRERDKNPSHRLIADRLSSRLSTVVVNHTLVSAAGCTNQDRPRNVQLRRLSVTRLGWERSVREGTCRLESTSSGAVAGEIRYAGAATTTISAGRIVLCQKSILSDAARRIGARHVNAVRRPHFPSSASRSSTSTDQGLPQSVRHIRHHSNRSTVVLKIPIRQHDVIGR
jgi:hypothetical protein